MILLFSPFTLCTPSTQQILRNTVLYFRYILKCKTIPLVPDAMNEWACKKELFAAYSNPNESSIYLSNVTTLKWTKNHWWRCWVYNKTICNSRPIKVSTKRTGSIHVHFNLSLLPTSFAVSSLHRTESVSLHETSNLGLHNIQ